MFLSASPVSQLFQILLTHPAMVPDLVQDGRADLLDEFLHAAAHLLDRLLKDVDDIRQGAGILDAATGARTAVIQTQEQVSLAGSQGLHLATSRPIPHFHAYLFEIVGESLWDLCEGLLHQLSEPLFTHRVRHAIYSFHAP